MVAAMQCLCVGPLHAAPVATGLTTCVAEKKACSHPHTHGARAGDPLHLRKQLSQADGALLQDVALAHAGPSDAVVGRGAPACALVQGSVGCITCCCPFSHGSAELYFRHVFSRLSPTLADRMQSWANYLELFGWLLEKPKQFRLPHSWLFDLIDECVQRRVLFFPSFLLVAHALPGLCGKRSHSTTSATRSRR